MIETTFQNGTLRDRLFAQSVELANDLFREGAGEKKLLNFDSRVVARGKRETSGNPRKWYELFQLRFDDEERVESN